MVGSQGLSRRFRKTETCRRYRDRTNLVFFSYFQPVRNPATVRLPKFISVSYDALTTGKLLGRFGAACFCLFQDLSCPRRTIPDLLLALLSYVVLRATVTES